MFGSVKATFMCISWIAMDPPTTANLQALRRRQRQSNCPRHPTANGAENGASLCFAVQRGREAGRVVLKKKPLLSFTFCRSNLDIFDHICLFFGCS